MNGKLKRVFFTMLCITITGMAFAEEASVIPQKTLRLTLEPSFAFQFQDWEWTGVSSEKVMLVNTGLGIEYGPADWINVQLLWNPGINIWSKIEGGKYGIISDLFLGIKMAVIGEEALAESEKIRFSLAAGMILPLAGFGKGDKSDAEREPDQHLWGSALRLYFDYVINEKILIDLYLEGVYYPTQWSSNPVFKTNLVKHYVDITAEMEAHFRFALGQSGYAIKFGFPVTFFFAPVMNANDEHAVKNQLYLGAGTYVGLVFGKIPLELLIRYNGAIFGKNTEPFHKVSLLGRFSVNLAKKS